MPELAGSNGGPGVAQTGYNGAQGNYGGAQGGYGGAQGGYGSTQGGYNGTQGAYDGTQGGYDGGYGNKDTKSQQYGGGGPPIAEVYTPCNGPQRAGYDGFVPSHSELPESPPVHMASPATPHTYPSTQQDHAGAVEMYGGYTGQSY